MILPIYFLSLEHHKLEDIFGKRSVPIGNFLGIFSGWTLFVFWIGIWVSPQPRFNLDPMDLKICISTWEISLTHLVVGLLFLIPGVYFGVNGVLDLGMMTSETHRPEKVVKTGIYKRVRHPQYLGGILGHISMTFLFSGLYSLYFTPIVISEIIVLCLKEEKELIREFGQDYIDYKKRVPMLFLSL
jgi:protein-S-isoprenylcysteine O-methyltransferase Ste14